VLLLRQHEQLGREERLQGILAAAESSFDRKGSLVAHWRTPIASNSHGFSPLTFRVYVEIDFNTCLWTSC
jgi:hypothetical protein